MEEIIGGWLNEWRAVENINSLAAHLIIIIIITFIMTTNFVSRQEARRTCFASTENFLYRSTGASNLIEKLRVYGK